MNTICSIPFRKTHVIASNLNIIISSPDGLSGRKDVTSEKVNFRPDISKSSLLIQLGLRYLLAIWKQQELSKCAMLCFKLLVTCLLIFMYILCYFFQKKVHLQSSSEKKTLGDGGADTTSAPLIRRACSLCSEDVLEILGNLSLNVLINRSSRSQIFFKLGVLRSFT